MKFSLDKALSTSWGPARSEVGHKCAVGFQFRVTAVWAAATLGRETQNLVGGI